MRIVSHGLCVCRCPRRAVPLCVVCSWPSMDYSHLNRGRLRCASLQCHARISTRICSSDFLLLCQHLLRVLPPVQTHQKEGKGNTGSAGRGVSGGVGGVVVGGGDGRRGGGGRRGGSLSCCVNPLCEPVCYVRERPPSTQSKGAPEAWEWTCCPCSR